MVLLRWILVFLYGAFIFVFAQSPDSSATSMTSSLLQWFPNLDQNTLKHLIFYLRKLAHVSGYYIATILVFLAAKVTPKLRNYPYIVALVCALSLAFLDEWYQTLLPHRTGAFMDVAIDSIGIVAALLTLKIVKRNSRH